MIPRPDLLDPSSPAGLEVFQLTHEAGVPASHIYMEAQIFAPDSRRFLLHRSAHSHGSDKDDPEHRYLLCDLADNGRLTPVTDEVGATAPSVTPDGRFFYYFRNETEPGKGRLTLKRRRLDGTEPETILVLDKPLPGTRFQPSRPYPLSTISSDGKRLALPCFLGDGRSEGAPWGLLVFDLEAASVSLILQGVSWCNLHPQYCRSLEPDASHDLLIQENHGNVCDAAGKIVRLVQGRGADIHVIRDDGMNFRDLPWGRDGNEFCQGHQCWRGRSHWAITSTGKNDVVENQLIEGLPCQGLDHDGIKTPGGVRNDLSRAWPTPKFYHFATDLAGKRFITDVGPSGPQGGVAFGFLGEPGKDPLQLVRLLTARGTWLKSTHLHPFLSPDGNTGFFNSDESGLLQAYMVRGLEKVGKTFAS